MDVAHIGCWLQDEACEVNVLRVVRFLRVWQKLLMWLDGCKIGLTVESEEGEVPHLRWSQAPPLPWRRPGSADYTWDLSFHPMQFQMAQAFQSFPPMSPHYGKIGIL